MNTQLIMEALAFAIAAHGEQKRKYTGEPYVNHVVAVARTVQALDGSDEMIAAALLHDVLEDTATTYVELVDKFGRKVADLVLELTDRFDNPVLHGNRATRKALERARLAQASPAAQTIKLADMLDNSASIMTYDPAFAKVYLPEKIALFKVLTKADQRLHTAFNVQMTEVCHGLQPQG